MPGPTAALQLMLSSFDFFTASGSGRDTRQPQFREDLRRGWFLYRQQVVAGAAILSDCLAVGRGVLVVVAAEATREVRVADDRFPRRRS